ncbi:MAG: hypothetical protein JWP36_983 [Paucimonas sp.]|nr:hypothetical protein [Paucimonas sp.]
MKILIPILGFGRAGGNRVLSQLANEWIRAGHEVRFLCPTSSGHPYFPTAAGILWCTPHGRVLPSMPAAQRYGGVRNLVALFRGLRQVGREYDVILANHSLTAWPVALANAPGARKTYYIQAYEPELYLMRRESRAKAFFTAALAAMSYHLPLQRIVNAPLYCRYRNLRAGDAVPPGLDLSLFHPGARARDLENADEIVLGCIGRVQVEKGTIYAVRAFEALYARDRRYRLRIAYQAPPGWSHPACEVVVPANDAELAMFYRSLDVMIAPAIGQHGAPHYPVLESGASGIPVVTSAYLGATRDTAWMAESTSPDSIAKAVEALVSQAGLRESRKDRFLALVDEFAWSRVSARMLEAIAARSQR